MDVKALRAEFELDEGMEILPQNGAGIVYRGNDEGERFVSAGGGCVVVVGVDGG